MSDVPRDEPEDARPWEAPGAVRRDVVPHRGNWLRALGTGALVAGVLSLCTAVTVLAAMPLALAALGLGQRDLARMRAGLMDPGGREDAELARVRAAVGLLFCLPGLFVLFLVLALLVW